MAIPEPPRSFPSTELRLDAASDLWRHTLSQIPCVFGRLVYLASMRNSSTGDYEHHGLALMFGQEEASKTLAESHGRAFGEWLAYSFEEQKADLDLYLSCLSSRKARLVETWLRLAPYRNFLPTQVRSVERQLFLVEVRALLDLLRIECGVDEPDPDA